MAGFCRVRFGWVRLGYPTYLYVGLNARFVRNIVKMRLFRMIFKFSVMYFTALHIEPRVAQQCF